MDDAEVRGGVADEMDEGLVVSFEVFVDTDRSAARVNDSRGLNFRRDETRRDETQDIRAGDGVVDACRRAERARDGHAGST
jgi:hypothetical protein